MNILPSDPRIGKMNTARWMMAHFMLVDRDRRWMRNFARFCGTDISMFRPAKDANSPSPTPNIFPLAAIINPEAYGKFVEQEEGLNVDEVPENIFEKQVEALENAGMLSDIDDMSEAAEKKVKEIKRQQMEELLPPIDPDK